MYVFPVLLWTSIIFFFSSKHFSAQNTNHVLHDILNYLIPSLSAQHFYSIHGFIRKSAHVFAYAMLSFFASVAIFKTFLIYKKWTLKFSIFVLIFTLTIAFLDEYNQSKIASRTGTIKDIFFDFSGALLVQAIVFIRSIFT